MFFGRANDSLKPSDGVKYTTSSVVAKRKGDPQIR